MATKKSLPKKGGQAPKQFNSQQAKNKWASLQGKANDSIEALVKGKATATDLQNIGSALQGMSDTAHQVFTEAVDVATAAASKSSPGPGVDNQEAVNRALAPHVDELLKQIKEIIELETRIQTEELESHMDQGFDGLGKLLPDPDLWEQLQDLSALNDMAAQAEPEDDEEGDFGKLADLVNGRADSQQAANDAQEKHVDEQFDRLQRFINRQAANEAHPGSTIDELNADHAVTSAQGSTVVPAAAQAERTRQDMLFDRLEQFLSGQSPIPSAADHDSDAEKDKDEEKKAGTWWKSFRDFVSPKKKSRSESSGNWLMDILKDLGTLELFTSIFDPKFWSNLSDGIEKNVTWDNLKKAFFKSWDWIKDRTSDTVNWLMKKLGVNGDEDALASTKHLTDVGNERLKKLPANATPVQKLNALGDAATAATYILNRRGPDGKLDAEGQAMLNAASPETQYMYAKYRRETESVTDAATRMASHPYLNLTNTGDLGYGDNVDANGKPIQPESKTQPKSTTVQTPQSPKSQRSTVTTVPTKSQAPKTSISVNTPAMQPSTSTPLPGQGPDPGQGLNRPPIPQQGAVGSPPVGNNTFGFTQGTSDALLLANSSIFGH